MMSKHPSIKVNNREPPKIATRRAIMPRGPEILASCLVIVLKRPVLDDICFGKTFCRDAMMLVIELGLKCPRMRPRIARMATAMGKMAVSRLYASAADRFMTQSLLNLVKKAING